MRFRFANRGSIVVGGFRVGGFGSGRQGIETGKGGECLVAGC
jgi:hypothetical protein